MGPRPHDFADLSEERQQALQALVRPSRGLQRQVRLQRLARVGPRGATSFKGLRRSTTPTWRAVLQSSRPAACPLPEVGHTFGLDHQDESGADLDTCMDYAKGLVNPSPTSTTGSGSTPPTCLIRDPHLLPPRLDDDGEQHECRLGAAKRSAVLSSAPMGARRPRRVEEEPAPTDPAACGQQGTTPAPQSLHDVYVEDLGQGKKRFAPFSEGRRVLIASCVEGRRRASDLLHFERRRAPR